MTSELEVRLHGSPEHPGHITLASLGPLATALQEVYDRIARLVGERPGPGRTPAALQSLSRLTLVGLREGSTGLALRRGDDTTLEVEPSEARDIEDRFDDIVRAMTVGAPPTWATAALAASTVRLIDALRQAAPRVVVTTAHAAPATIDTERLDAEPWKDRALTETGAVAVIGVLEAVDLTRGRFRVRDDVGNRIPLVDVPDAHRSAQLIGRRVMAEGSAARRADGLLREVRRPSLVEDSMPTEWTTGGATDIAALVSAASDASPADPINLTDEEFGAFMRAARG